MSAFSETAKHDGAQANASHRIAAGLVAACWSSPLRARIKALARPLTQGLKSERYHAHCLNFVPEYTLETDTIAIQVAATAGYGTE